MGQISLQQPVLGNPDSTEEPKIVSDLTIIQNAINGNLDYTNLNTSAGILGVDPVLRTPSGLRS